jgi:hypothetical protein
METNIKELVSAVNAQSMRLYNTEFLPGVLETALHQDLASSGFLPTEAQVVDMLLGDDAFEDLKASYKQRFPATLLEIELEAIWQLRPLRRTQAR